MSISAALTSALSGLTVTARRAEVVSSNVANATTPGYVRRELVVGARIVGDQGQGVASAGLRRDQDTFLLNDRRRAGADAEGRSLIAGAMKRIEEGVGLPGEENSVSARIAAVETALIAASADPASESRLAAVADAIGGLTRHMARATGTIQALRADADTRIGAEVQGLNANLLRVRELNVQILNYANTGRETASLLDQRQVVIDAISTVVPVREQLRADGMVALYTTRGAALVEGSAVTVGFEQTGVVTPAMSVASGALSGLTVNGRPVDAGPNGPLSGGSLGALFRLRDDVAPKAQAHLDALARDLLERLSDPALDPTRPAGAPGLLTDAGQAFDAADEVGLAGRLRLNAAADPGSGGGLWRLRDGLGSAVPGPQGDGSLLASLRAAFGAAREPVSGGMMSGARSATAFAGDVVSRLASDRLDAESEAAFASTYAATLEKLEADGGVDTDHELQDLMQIEQAYAANARVVKVADQMLQHLLEM